MKHSLLEHLRCPSCKARFDLIAEEVERNQVKTGKLTCQQCSRVFPVSRFVPRFVDADKYADTFSRQRLYVRKHFEHYRRDRSGDASFLPTTGFSADELKTGLSLEIGCGYGRYVDVVQRLGGAIVGVDLSTHSIDLAHDFIGFNENVFLVQADLFALPFDLASFQHVYSIGVLHHTPSTRDAFRAVVPYVRPGGRVSIWLYHSEDKRSADRWRTFTPKLNHRLLYGMCIANQVLFSWIRALPGGWRFGLLVPGAMPKKGSHFWMRVLSDFDGWSPTFAHSHTEDEVAGWFRDEGLSDVQVLSRRTAVTGRRRHSD